MSLWFVTPAFRRYDLSEVCFEQRRRVIDALGMNGVEAHCVVVADDDNLDIARSKSFDVAEQDNAWLGRKFNDGIEYAAKHGAEWIVPIGSDSWIDPAYFLPLPLKSQARTAQQYAAVTADKMAVLRVRTASGAGPYVLHRDILAPTRFRPAADAIRQGVDGSTIRGIVRTGGSAPAWRWRRLHDYQYIGFRGTPHITPYDRLRARWGVSESSDPWALLAAYYPGDLVEQARRVLAMQAVAA